MWHLLATLGCLLVLTSAQSSVRFPPMSDELIDYVNKRNTTWKVRWGPRLCTRTPGGGAAAVSPRMVCPGQLIQFTVRTAQTHALCPVPVCVCGGGCPCVLAEVRGSIQRVKCSQRAGEDAVGPTIVGVRAQQNQQLHGSAQP